MGSLPQVAARYGYPKQFEQYDTQFAGMKENIGWTWWDVNPYTTAVTTNLGFFTTMKATINLSNMESAGQLASPKAFFLRAIRVKPYLDPFDEALVAAPAVQTGLTTDLVHLFELGVAQLTIGQKIYGQWPLWMLSAGGGIVSKMGIVAASVLDYANNGIEDPRAVYALSKPLFIAPQINFRVDLLWPAGAVTFVSTGPISLWVGLDGDLIRPVQ